MHAQFLVPVLPSGKSFVLDGEEGRHAATVRRMRAGERLVLSDGLGGTALCEVTAARKDTLELAVLATNAEPAPVPCLVVVQALPKGDRGELAVEVLTEVGVDEIIPWQASRCVTRWQGERGEKALRRWRSTAREAGKQARRAWLPQVTEPHSTAQVAARIHAADVALVLHEEAEEPLSRVALPECPREIVLVVGPEGGIAPAELEAFGARPVRLGASVLRTSTAGAVAAGIVFARTGRW